jgi:threonyl-tRNA synthetase
MALKPMNCPGHIQIYKDTRHSYRDLPVRYSEPGLLHRHEPSGVLHGLLRVRHITQDDAHIFCTEEQVEDEVVGCLRFGLRLYDLFGFEPSLELSTRPSSGSATTRCGTAPRARSRARSTRGGSPTS